MGLRPAKNIFKLWRAFPLCISITEATDALGVSRKTLSELLSRHIGISPKMARRLSTAS